VISHIEVGIRELVTQFIESGRPCAFKQAVQDRRDGYLASSVLAGASPQMAEEYEDIVAGVSIKIFQPTQDSNLPITIYFHGGCFISGGFDTHNQQLRQLALSSNTLVICIKYRLAPEHPYPAAHDDVYKATLAIKQSGSKFGNTDRIIFVGDSAGAQLALITSLRLRNQQDWLPQKQILIYPMLDPDGTLPSYLTNGSDYIITANMLLSGFAMYMGDKAKHSANPELYPLKQADFSGLPSTCIITAEFDPLRDEGEQLYRALLDASVEAYCQRYLGVIHGFFQLSGVSQSAVSCMENIANQIKA
jgi:acetyl esterase